MLVQRDNLLRVVKSVEYATTQKDVTEQSSCVVFKDGECLAYNDEIACRTPSKLDKSFQGAVQADMLVKILDKTPDDEIDVDFEPGELVIKSKRKTTVIHCEKDISLQIDVVEKPKSWNNLHDDFTRAIDTIHQCADKSGERASLTCVHIHPKWIESTDRMQIARWKMSTGFKAEALVKSANIKHISTLGMDQFAETDTWVHFKNPNSLVFSCRKLLDEYINLTPYLKVKDYRIIKLPKVLSEAAQRAEIFAADNATTSNVIMIKVEIDPSQKFGLKVTGRGIRGYQEERYKLLGYEGPKMAFFIPSKILSDLVNKHNECMITETAIKVKTGSYIYLTGLTAPEEKTSTNKENRDG